MYRYIAFIGSAEAGLERQLAGNWKRVFAAPGLKVFHAEANGRSSDVWPIENGVALGKLFPHHPGASQPFERYWGRYVAIARDPVSGVVSVWRDPSGALPCWLTSYQGVHIVCSDIEDCPVRTFSINWDFVAGFVAHAALQIRNTALNEVSEVQPGERLSLVRGAVERSIEWNPIAIARSSQFERVDEAVEALRAATLDCIHAWSACYDGIVHNLSGGLDSSIVLTGLNSAPTRPDLTCLNYFALGPHEDERRYARMMAERVGVKLVEHQLDPRELPLRDLLRLRRSPRPWFYLYEIEHGRFETELAAQQNAQALFSGSGGDGVFFQARADLAVTDYLFEHGLGPRLLTTAIDAARVLRKSVWSVLAKSIRTRIQQSEFDPVALAKPAQRTLVSKELVESARREKGFVHPWLSAEAMRGVPPGILWHVMSISMPPAFYSSFERGPCPERVMPLLSQPLVETCLRIPTYLLIGSGRDRAVARKAFERDLPAEIVRRQAKGRADRHIRNIMDANLELVRELLLDGVLVQRGLLNREALELYLTRESSPADFQYSEILQEHLCTEAWLRSWGA
jgi:asparagine synthase (glutamine-hydrolysing)